MVVRSEPLCTLGFTLSDGNSHRASTTMTVMRLASALLLMTTGMVAWAEPPSTSGALTVYAARFSSEPTWQHVLRNPFGASYADAYLLAASYSRPYTRGSGGPLSWEWEGNLAYNFGDQDHFELNLAPAAIRWHRFPWSERVNTTAGMGVGLSYAFGFPDLENEIEGDTRQLLIYWFVEVTAGPPEGHWSVALRLHHRSTGFGLMGVEDGGMNAPGLGFRYEF
jgi:hypothetical protein